jgi:hypothetical protein
VAHYAGCSYPDCKDQLPSISFTLYYQAYDADDAYLRVRQILMRVATDYASFYRILQQILLLLSIRVEAVIGAIEPIATSCSSSFYKAINHPIIYACNVSPPLLLVCQLPTLSSRGFTTTFAMTLNAKHA